MRFTAKKLSIRVNYPGPSTAVSYEAHNEFKLPKYSDKLALGKFTSKFIEAITIRKIIYIEAEGRYFSGISLKISLSNKKF